MGQNQTSLLQGTLDLLILKAIGESEFHGLGISHRIEQITHGTFQVKPGSLFPALHRMEEAGCSPRSGENQRTTAGRNITSAPNPMIANSVSRRNSGRPLCRQWRTP